MAEKSLKAKFRGVLKIGDLEIPCFVTENELRVLSGRGMTGAVGMKGRGQGITRILTNKTLKPFINDELELAIKNPLHITGFGLKTYGYEATVLLQICESILEAREEGKLKTAQEKRYGKFSEILVRSLAKVGIIALVDEATGYQEIRDRIALQKILDRYLREDLAKWAKTFPDDFYEGLFRLRGWQYRPLSVKRPGVIGHLTNDIVYRRLVPGVLGELRKRNPVTESGRRKHKHFQWLTEDVGHPRLREHLAAVIALMKASSNWDQFKRAIERALPKYGDTMPLDLNEPEDE
jgi:hypothetical protein